MNKDVFLTYILYNNISQSALKRSLTELTSKIINMNKMELQVQVRYSCVMHF